MTTDPYTAAARLCDDDGIVRKGWMHHGTDYPCTGHAHFAGEHYRCTGPTHAAAFRPDLTPIYDAADRAMQDELRKWTVPVSDELRLGLSRAVVGSLRDASMLNYDRPWELDDRLADVLTEAGEKP